MKEPERKSVPVDPNKPEQPVALLVSAVQYLMDECGRWHQLADAAVGAKTAYPQAVLVGKLCERIGMYRQRGLEALARITETLVKEHNAQAAQVQQTQVQQTQVQQTQVQQTQVQTRQDPTLLARSAGSTSPESKPEAEPSRRPVKPDPRKAAHEETPAA